MNFSAINPVRFGGFTILPDGTVERDGAGERSETDRNGPEMDRGGEDSYERLRRQDEELRRRYYPTPDTGLQEIPLEKPGQRKPAWNPGLGTPDEIIDTFERKKKPTIH